MVRLTPFVIRDFQREKTVSIYQPPGMARRLAHASI